MAAPRPSEADIARAIKGVERCGLPIRGVEVDREGNVRVIVGEPEPVKLGSAADLIQWKKP